MTENSVSVKWEPPLEGGFILHYIVEKRLQKSYSLLKAWRRVVADICDTEYQVNGLTVGKTYLLRVAAVNEVGVGPFAQLPNPVTTRLQYGKLKHSVIVETLHSDITELFPQGATFCT